MRKRIVLYLTAALISVACIAQDAHKKIDRETLREKILKKKNAVYVERLALTKEEADKFWNIYENYYEALFKLRTDEHKFKSKFKDKDLLSLDVKTAEEYIKISLETDKKINEVQEEYIEKFSAVLPPQKIAKLIDEESKILREIANEGRQKCEKHTCGKNSEK